MTFAPPVDTALLERRRRLAFRASCLTLLTAVVCWPIGMAVGGSESRDTIAGAFLMAAIVGAVACPWIVRAWQGFMRRRMLTAAVAGRTDIRHIDAEHQQAGSQSVLASEAFSLGAFRDSGLVEAFQTATVTHILTGEARGVPFGLAEIALLDAKGYRMFGGVLACFRLARFRPGLTLVMRDRGLLGNLLERAGSRIERLTLEDPSFEGLFEVYGDDQVAGRVILTTTMLERLKALDELGHAQGFACAFRGDHLLVAFRGMAWRCAAWRIVQPVDRWLQIYATWLAGLVDLPVEIVQTLNLAAAPAGREAPRTPRLRADAGVPLSAGTPDVFSSALWRLVGEGGMALVYVASGSMFGGLALVAGRYGITVGFAPQLFWYLWGMVVAGLAYGAYAVGLGLRDLARLAWRWNSPLRTLKRP
ncbi:MAG: DUF3137 domain-containing protein [Vicinamibacterales bacterium]